MNANERKALEALALASWEPEYPGQEKPILKVWFAGEPETGLSGFHSEDDRNNFSAGQDGPFLRRVTGTSFLQMPFRSLRKGDTQ